ncbi:MAG: TIGR00282 family metallophosphoesterase [Holophagales bacterium]|jgi:metallophosphoesterase (TIGR00282 family)|nr:TIGR00282 family metallophosphoesterase [Holophagales bacterium]
MRILMLGDVVGEPGRKLLETFLPVLRRDAGVDFVVVNGENAAHGHGITENIARHWLETLGVNVITTGNHAFDVKGISAYFQQEPRLIRPANWPPNTPGNGYVKIHTATGEEILIINFIGRVGMATPADCPFRAADAILAKERADVVLIDIHAEATSERQALGCYLDGRVSAVLGTHTHVPTLDERILPNGTAFVTDVGMVGPYESVIGMEKHSSLSRFLKVKGEKWSVAERDLQLHGVLVETQGRRAVHIERVIRKL